MIDIQPQHKLIVEEILLKYVPEALVYAFGSRVALTAKPHSDLDLVIVGKEAIPIQRMHELEEAFSESALPFRVDVLDWHKTTDEFRKHISRCCEIIKASSGLSTGN